MGFGEKGPLRGPVWLLPTGLKPPEGTAGLDMGSLPPGALAALPLARQVAFRHVNDYVTYVWVQDNEISSEDRAKQVKDVSRAFPLLSCSPCPAKS